MEPNDPGAPPDFAAWRSALRSSYDRVADEYAAHIYDELRHKPFDRELLSQLAARVGGLGPICDLGCGPGQVARYLRDQGAAAFGIDLSEGMLTQARRLNPDLTFRQGDMLALSDPAESWGGVAAFYSLIHIPRERVPQALAQLWRVLRPGGRLLVAVHCGHETVHRDELFGQPISIDFIFYEPEVLEGHLREAGFVVDEITVREPYPEVEVATRRAYLMAHKP